MPPASPTNDGPPVIVFGVLPPPVTGMTLCTEAVADFLQPHCAVRRCNLSDGSGKVTWGFRIRKFGRMVAALARLLFGRNLRDAVLYMPLNSGFAMYYNVAAAMIARLRGWRTVIHHHTYFYLVRRDWRVPLLDRLVAGHGLHLVLCGHMRERLVETYGIRTACALLPSTILLAQEAAIGQTACPKFAPSAPQCLGHISNLSTAKGTLLAIETFQKLREDGQDVRMIVAGPILEPTIADEIRRAQERFHDAFDYRGPVYGEAKKQFFEAIDVLLFPSRMEAQPLVLSEAFAYAKPALAMSISCIPSLMGREDWHVPLGKDYIDFAAERIKHWRDHPQKFGEAQQFAYQRVAALKQDAESALRWLLHWINQGRGVDTLPEPSLPEQTSQPQAVATP